MHKYRFTLLICVITFLFLGHTLEAQFIVSGSVRDAESNQALIGVNIIAQSTNNGTSSDNKGFFSLELAEATTLEFSYVGYQSITLAIEKDETLTIGMTEVISELNAIEVKALKIIELQMPASVMHIPKENLTRDNETSIAPALNRVTGVYMHSGALNTNRITIRGIGNRSLFSTTKIRAYLDDIPLTTGDGETTIEDIDLSLIQSVDVWKGPTASMYGAGLGGMIHYKTRAQEDFLPSSLSTNFTIGSYGLVRNVSQFNFTNTKKTLNTVLNYNTTESDGYRDNNHYDRESITLMGKYLSGKSGETTLFGNFNRLKAFIPSSLSRTDYDENPSKAAFTWGNVKGFEDYDKIITGLSHQFKIGHVSTFEVTNKTSAFFTNRDSYESTPFNILEESSSSLGLRNVIEINKRGQLKRQLPLLSIGFETFTENYDWQTFETNNGIAGAQFSNNEEQRKYINIFAQSYFALNAKATLFTGVNFNNTTYDYRDLLKANGIDKSGDYGFEPIISPHLGFNYQFNSKVALFTTVSHGFSPPSLEETLTPEGTINPDIQVEQGWNYEIGTRGNIEDKLTYELTVYTMEIKDLLVARRVGADQFIGLNAGKTQHRGLEAFLSFAMVKNNQFQIGPFISYTFSDYSFKEFIDADNDYAGNALTGTPPHQFNGGIDFNTVLGFYGNINYQFIDAFPMRDDNSIYSDAYQVVRAKIGFQRNLSTKFIINAAMGIDNIFNEKYASMILINAGSFGNNAPRYYYPGLPRNYFGNISLTYKL